MICKTIFAVAALAAALPAAAATVDAFSSFDATQGAGGFTYGSYDGAVFTLFDSSSACVIGGVTCLRATAANLPTVLKSTSAIDTTDGTVNIAADRLLVHPGEFTASVFLAFTATVAGTYSYTASFNQQDSNTAQHSVGVTEFFTPLSGATQTFGTIVVNQAAPSVTTGFTQFLAVGDSVGFIIDKNGVYFNDATGVNFSVSSAVPEPSSWVLMIAGFGLVGAGLRRRSGALTA